MIAIILLGGVLLASVLLSYLRTRRRGGDPVARHELKLSTLRGIYEQSDTADETGAQARVTSRPPDHGANEGAQPRQAPMTLPPVISEARVRAEAGMTHRSRRRFERPQLRVGATVVIAVALGVGLAAVVGAIVASRNDTHKRTSSTTHTVAQTTAPTTAPATTSVPTTAPPPTTSATLAVVMRNGTPTVVAAPPFTLAFTANATSWVQLRDGNGGTLYTATMASGQSQSVPVTGAVSMRLGNTRGMTLTVNGRPVDTATVPSPGTIQFVAS